MSDDTMHPSRRSKEQLSAKEYTERKCPLAAALAQACELSLDEWHERLNEALNPIVFYKLDALGVDTTWFRDINTKTILGFKWGSIVIHGSEDSAYYGEVVELL